LEWITGDAMDASTVIKAAKSAQLLVHAISPPQYRNWRKWAIPMLANSIDAAVQARARLILPGNVYNYGPDAGALVRENSPQHPLTRKGAIRVEMEAMLYAAVEKRGLRALVVRAGDYFGSSAVTAVFAQIILPAKPGAPVRYLGAFEVGHAWAYLSDLAETIAQLAARDEDLPAWDTFNFGGHWLPRGVEIAEIVRRVTGNPKPVGTFPWLLVRLASPVYPLAREMAEMRYLWQTPLQLDNAKLTALLGKEPHTELEEAVRTAIAGLKQP
jgi:nucleoside-diphosphate-sugar epimerase